MLCAAERTTRTLLLAPTRARFAAAISISTITVLLSWLGWRSFGMTPTWLAWCWAAALSCGLVLTDIRCQRLPFPLVTALAAGLIAPMLGAALIDGDWSRFRFACVAGATVFTIAVLVQLCAPTHTGGGDTALYGAIALFLGWFGWAGLMRGLLMASILTGVVALLIGVSSRSMNSRFPAGPSLLAGALLSILLT
ncbi:methyltransferase [Amycolatopsis acidicola]|uniref:Methyltransferase n=2 Tax=Amycolatopsis acidicola TaxID=2596893 RepID=A0A5N0UZR1_9PSEU|nr:methyltransferase [Amycolatopsis acidicola]